MGKVTTKGVLTKMGTSVLREAGSRDERRRGARVKRTHKERRGEKKKIIREDNPTNRSISTRPRK